MAEAFLDVRKQPREIGYALAHTNIIQLLDGIDDPVAVMSTVSSVLHNAFGFLWTGFYRVVSPGMLRVGPYQGTVGCLEIPIGKGVCGTAAAERRTIIVPDVSRFPGHIACDSRSRSEIVVPLLDRAGTLVAVFDVDSEQLGAFDDRDRHGLEQIMTWIATR